RREPVVGANRCPGTPNSPVSRERESQDLALAGVTSVISVLERRTIGAVAQWERITLAVWGSRVRIPPAPPRSGTSFSTRGGTAEVAFRPLVRHQVGGAEGVFYSGERRREMAVAKQRIEKYD